MTSVKLEISENLLILKSFSVWIFQISIFNPLNFNLCQKILIVSEKMSYSTVEKKIRIDKHYAWLKLKHLFIFILTFYWIMSCYSQGEKPADTIQYFNLDQCIVYAMQHQPAVIQSDLGITIARKTNAINLSAWLPQVNLNGMLTHYIQLPTSFVTNTLNPPPQFLKENQGFVNTLVPQLSVTETIFSPDVLNSARSAHLIVEQAKQSGDSTRINLVASVSKSFYNLLFTLEQMKVLQEDTARLKKNLKDTYHQYIGGIVDKTDYKQATITLNNSKAQLKQTYESIKPEYASLKQLMGLPQETRLNLIFDTLKMMQEIVFDTTQQLQIEKRIEYQLLQTNKKLQQQTVNYYRSQFLPSLSALYSYNYQFETNPYGNFLNQAYPYSYIGGTLSIPLFTGFRRSESIQKAKLQLQQLDLEEYNLKSGLYIQYSNALATYKSNLYDLSVLRENVTMAKDVYSVVSFQYKQGVVPYLNVITAESDLVSSEISYINSLFQLLLSKVDLEKALGSIQPK